MYQTYLQKFGNKFDTSEVTVTTETFSQRTNKGKHFRPISWEKMYRSNQNCRLKLWNNFKVTLPQHASAETETWVYRSMLIKIYNKL